jgi:uncharacterized protein (TIGR02001 family)
MKRATAETCAVACAALAGQMSMSVVGAAPAASAQELGYSFGADLTTNYLAKGFTQTDNKPAFQPWGEVNYGMFYGFFWASNVDFGEEDIELDLGAGIRPTLGPVALDIGFVQYLYRDDDEDYGEIYVAATYPVTDRIQVGFSYWREVYADYNTFYVDAGYEGLPWDLSVSGGIGSDFGSRDLDKDATYADLGVTKEFAEHFAFDVRGHYSEIEHDRLVATLSFFY